MKQIIEQINKEFFHFRNENIVVDENDKNTIKEKIILPLSSFNVQNIEKSGLILDLTSQNMFYGEITRQIYKNVLEYIFKSVFIKKIDGSLPYNNDSVLYNLLNNSINYTLVSNIQIATCISDMPILVATPFNKLTTSGVIYELGNINNNIICVDPNMRWDDNRMAMVYNKFFNFKIDSLVDFKHIETFIPKLDVDVYIKFDDVIADLYQVENIII